jgi:hypothetical protein
MEAKADTMADIKDIKEDISDIKSNIKDLNATDVAVSGYKIGLRASLSGNLDLIAQPEAFSAGQWQSILDSLNPSAQRVVIFARNQGDPLLPQVLAAAKKFHLEATIHAVPEGQALKFGLKGF